jgi:hypothetical protein
VAAESRLINHQFSKPNILHNFHRFLTPDHLQLLQNHHNVFLILQLLLNDSMLQLVMGMMALWNRTKIVIGKRTQTQSRVNKHV